MSDPRAPRLVPDAAGFDLRPDPLKATTPGEFVGALRRYWTWAGETPYRQLAGRAGGTPSASTFWNMLHGQELPRESNMLAFVDACGVTEEDRQRFVTAWRILRLARHDAGSGAPQVPAPRSAAERVPDRQDR